VRPPSPAVARRRKIVARAALGAVIAIAGLFVYVVPARSLLDQRQQQDKARDRLELLRDQNAELERESRRLLDDDEVERIAREQYGMVRPGEQPYVAVPTPPSSTAPPPTSTTTPAPVASP
jgi:cell division protein FtsB